MTYTAQRAARLREPTRVCKGLEFPAQCSLKRLPAMHRLYCAHIPDRHKTVITTLVYQRRHQRTTCYCCLKLGVLAAQPDCEEWARNGECEKSPRYMFWGCRMSCGRCFPPTLQVRETHFCEVPAYSLRPSASSAKAVPAVCYYERESVAQRC